MANRKKELAVELYLEGISITKIAEKLELSRETIYKYLRLAKINTKRQNRLNISKETKELFGFKLTDEFVYITTELNKKLRRKQIEYTQLKKQYKELEKELEMYKSLIVIR